MANKHVFVSDLHLEFNGSAKLLGKQFPEADILIVAGDLIPAASLNPKYNDPQVRSARKAFSIFKSHVCPRYKHVFVLAGNHEYYGSFWQDVIPTMREAFADTPNVTYMENDSKEIDGVLYLGATVWTNFKQRDPIAMEVGRAGMNDYQCILDKDAPHYFGKPVPITPEHTWQAHDHSMRWMNEMLANNSKKTTVVITHHAPTFQSCGWRQHLHSELNPCYASALEYVILTHEQIRYWVHGHTHASMEYPVGNNCFVISNQCGYSHDYHTFKKFSAKNGVFDL